MSTAAARRSLAITIEMLGVGAGVLDYEGRSRVIGGEDRGLVARADGEPVGYLIFHPSLPESGPSLHLYSAWVAESARKRGVFKQMSAHLVAAYPGYTVGGYGVDDFGAVRRFLKRAARQQAAGTI